MCRPDPWEPGEFKAFMNREVQEDIESLQIEVDRKARRVHEANLDLMEAERVYGHASRRLEILRRQSEGTPCDHTSGPLGRATSAINPTSGKCELCGNKVTSGTSASVK